MSTAPPPTGAATAASPAPTAVAQAGTAPVVEVRNLRKTYPGPRGSDARKVAVEDVSFTVAPGEIFGILGPNGAGKTTTVECLAGLREADGGLIRVLGVDPQADPAAVRDAVGVQLQEAALHEKITVEEALRLFASFYEAPSDVEELLDLLDLAEHRRVAFGKLSGGQKQRLSIALALVGNPRIAVLDELTTGLDPQARRETWALIEDVRARGVTVLLITHFMEEAERLCDRVAVIDAGRVLAIDRPDELAARVDAEQRISFRPSQPLDLAELEALPEVGTVERRGETILVRGGADTLAAVTALLARKGIVARGLRIDQANLEDAFVALTGDRSASE
jgi:ABC-2 type transport system ATP-binding protein